MPDERMTTYVQLVMTDWGPSEEPLSDNEIVVDYWRAQARRWADQFDVMVRRYDALTLGLCQAFGDDWEKKVGAAIDRKARKSGGA